MSLFSEIDGLLRGRYTKAEDLQAGRIPLSARSLIVAGLLLGACYGAFMGIYSLMRPDAETALQCVLTIFKVPLLFMLTLLVTVPSLYAFSALAGSRLSFQATIRLLLAAITVNLALLASLGPVTAFFTLSTESYDFLVILNVIMFGVSGIVGVVFLRRALNMMFVEETPATEIVEPPAAPSEAPKPPPVIKWPDDPDRQPPDGPEPPKIPASAVRKAASPNASPSLVIFRTWIFVYGVVGAQMGWILRPFIGAPDQPFVLFRERDSNFFEAVVQTLGRLLGG